jgi:hypothetical protein
MFSKKSCLPANTSMITHHQGFSAVRIVLCPLILYLSFPKSLLSDCEITEKFAKTENFL